MLNRLPILALLLAGGIAGGLAGTLAGGCNKSDDSAGAGNPATRPTSAAAAATQPAAAPAAPPGPAGLYPATTQPGRIRAGDLVSLSIGNMVGPGTNSTVAALVAPDGTVPLPYLPKPLAVAGMTDADAAEAIVKAYREAQVAQDLPVHVRRLRLAGTGDPAVLPAGPIGNYDLVRVTVGNLIGPGTETAVVGRVDGEGMFSLPYLGRQKFAGLTDQQAGSAIADAYKKAKILQDAPVSVLRLEAAPPEAGKVDLPDVPIHPVPQWLWWLFDTRDSMPVILNRPETPGRR